MNKLSVTVKPTEINGQWEVVEGLTYKGIEVKPGQLTDGASIPWFIQPLLPKGGSLFAAAVIHDTCYRQGLLTRKECDDIFLQAMLDNNVNKFRRYLIYKGVRLFGGYSYND